MLCTRFQVSGSFTYFWSRSLPRSVRATSLSRAACTGGWGVLLDGWVDGLIGRLVRIPNQYCDKSWHHIARFLSSRLLDPLAMCPLGWFIVLIFGLFGDATCALHRFFRHPSYFGWFWWSLSTQVSQGMQGQPVMWLAGWSIWCTTCVRQRVRAWVSVCVREWVCTPACACVRECVSVDVSVHVCVRSWCYFRSCSRTLSVCPRTSGPRTGSSPTESRCVGVMWNPHYGGGGLIRFKI